jgi:serine protease AprX
MERRYKVRFRSTEALRAALAIESTATQPVVVNEARRYIALQPGPAAMAESMDPGVRTSIATRAIEQLAKTFEAEVVIDVQYDMEQTTPHVLVEAAPEATEASLDDVIQMNKAKEAWGTSRGGNVTIAIVDTGIHGGHQEFAPAKRNGGWSVPGDDPWTDWQGHGTMCACIAAATSAHGGKYNGVAPDAKIMSCKTRFFDSELAAIYDALTDRVKQEEIHIVASNSFGIQTGTAPTPDPNSDFLPALDDAVAAGVLVVFSAGNYHGLAGGQPIACSPNSIWLYKSRADILAVATCRLDRTMWDYSSRGRGQHFGSPNTSAKPDVTAPTPRNGRILYGTGESVMANGWGTSGACPQVAGLAALLISADPNLTRADVFRKIRNSAQTLGFAAECQGSGLIDCAASFATA